jgi:hypothetical protein
MAISRRHYAEVIAFLKQTVKNPKASLRMRMSAAQRLDDIFARHMEAEERETIRQERADARALGIKSGAPVQQVPEPDDTPVELSATDLERQRIDTALGWIPKPEPQR